jgi:hypothetical protein
MEKDANPVCFEQVVVATGAQLADCAGLAVADVGIAAPVPPFPEEGGRKAAVVTWYSHVLSFAFHRGASRVCNRRRTRS